MIFKRLLVSKGKKIGFFQRFAQIDSICGGYRYLAAVSMVTNVSVQKTLRFVILDRVREPWSCDRPVTFGKFQEWGTVICCKSVYIFYAICFLACIFSYFVSTHIKRNVCINDIINKNKEVALVAFLMYCLQDVDLCAGWDQVVQMG